MINHHSLSTYWYLGSGQRFTVVLEPIFLIGQWLAGCTGRKTYRINRAPERINGLLHSGSLWLLPPNRLLYSFVSPPWTIIIKHAFLHCHTKWCVNVGLLMNLNVPAVTVVLFHYTLLYVSSRKGYPRCNVNRHAWICSLISCFFHWPATGLYNRIMSWCVTLEMLK